MVRVVAMVAAIAAFFAAAVFLGGNAVGAWDDPRIPPDTRAPGNEREKAKRPPATKRIEARRERRAARATVEWTRRVDALCLRASDEVARLEPPTTPAGAKAYLERIVEMNRRYNDAFARLRPPRALAHDAARVLRLLRRDERLIATLLAAAERDDRATMTRTAAELREAATLESALLLALGARSCDAGLFAYAHDSG